MHTTPPDRIFWDDQGARWVCRLAGWTRAPISARDERGRPRDLIGCSDGTRTITFALDRPFASMTDAELVVAIAAELHRVEEQHR